MKSITSSPIIYPPEYRWPKRWLNELVEITRSWSKDGKAIITDRGAESILLKLEGLGIVKRPKPDIYQEALAYSLDENPLDWH